MLKNLLKYEFRATARTYGGIYLALLAAAGLIGFSLRGDRVAAQSHVFEIGVTIYSLLVMALMPSVSRISSTVRWAKIFPSFRKMASSSTGSMSPIR